MSNLFDDVLETFENDDVKNFAQKVINAAPEYWHHVGASSTGKYHPAYSLGDGGLVRHTIAVVRFLNHMFAVESIANQFTSRERDLLRVAAIAHDSKKSGDQEDYEKSKWTKFDHPLRAAKFVESIEDKNITDKDKAFCMHAIESHMGAFNTDKRYPDIVLPKPEDKYQIILHLADYLASRKDIEMKFDEKEFPMPQPENVNDWKFTFGKHKGKTIPEVDEIDHQYIEWATENMDREPAKTLLKEFSNQK